MKRIIIAMCIIAILFSIAACGEQANNTDKDNKETNSSYSDLKDTSNTESKSGVSDLPGQLDVNLSTAKYSIGMPDTLEKRANTGYMVELGSYFVIYDQYVDPASKINYEITVENIKGASDIWTEMKSQILANAKNGLIRALDYDIVISQSEDVKINSWTMNKVEGKITLSSSYEIDYNEAKMAGYGLIKDGFPIYFIVVEKPNGNTPIDVGMMAERIANSFKDNNG